MILGDLSQFQIVAVSMSESKGKLELFTLPGKGRAEAIRMMLVFVDKKFTDTRLTIEQWKIKRQLSEHCFLLIEEKVDLHSKLLEEVFSRFLK